MNKTDTLEEQIGKVLEEHDVCSFGTVDGERPKVRYMALFHEGLTVYLATNSKTDKVEEVAANPNVHVLVGYDGKPSSHIVQLQGRAEFSKDNALRERLWNDHFSRWFDGPHDPEYAILKISPERIEYSEGEGPVKVWTP